MYTRRRNIDTRVYKQAHLEGILWTKRGSGRATAAAPGASLAPVGPGVGLQRGRGILRGAGAWALGLGAGAALLIAAAAVMLITMENAQRTVLLNNDGQLVELVTTQATVAGVLEAYGVSLEEGDAVSPSLESQVDGGDTIRITKPMLVTVHTEGRDLQVKMQGGTVEEALALAGVTLEENDIVEPGLTDSLLSGAYIRVVRVETDTEYRETTIPYKVVFKADANLEEGKERIAQEGANGVLRTAYSVITHDGAKIGEEAAGSEVVAPAKDLLVYVGTKKKPVVVAAANTGGNQTAGGGSSNTGSSNTGSSNTGSTNTGTQTGGNTGNFSYSDTFTVKATAYTHTGNRTASGKWPKVGMIAVDPKVIPMGTRVYVEGYGYAVAEDTGGKWIQGRQIDLFMDTEGECWQWGIQRVRIYILN